MSVPHHGKSEAQPESRPKRRQPAFSIIPQGETAARTGSESLDAGPGDLPDLYHRNRLWAIARDPYCLFCYWEIAFPVHRFPGAHLALTVYRRKGRHESTQFLDNPAGTCAIDVSEPGAEYSLALGFLARGRFSREDMLFTVMERTVRTPRDSPVPRRVVRIAADGVLTSPGDHPSPFLAALFPDLSEFARREPGGAPGGSPAGPHLPHT